MAALALVALLGSGCGGRSGGGAPVRVVVPAGASLRQASDSLARAGVVRSSLLFRLYASLAGKDRQVKAGTYAFERGRDWGEVLEALTRGKGIVHTVTIPEGFELSAIVPLLARSLETPADSVDAAVRDTSLLRRLGVPTPTLEGYLFPETYRFAGGTAARAAVTEMVETFERRWKPEWTGRLGALGMTRHQVVTLASIVEKEARIAEERPIIAAVYHNRLRDGMLLQADPTVQYALGRRTPRVLLRDLEVDSPYNTYKYAGLPPGPIASPGTPSIEAALFPADVPFKFFVAHPDGHHEFRVTFEEHTAAREQIRRAQARSAERGTGGR